MGTQEARVAGAASILGAITMVVGAALWGSTGTDVERALVDDLVGAYLTDAALHRGILLANLTTWCVGAPLLGLGGHLMASDGRAATGAARFVYTLGAAVGVVAFVAWMAVLAQGSPAPDASALAVARVMLWFAWGLDVVATALLIGVAPAALAAAGPSWMPGWLRAWAVVAMGAGVLQVVPYVTPVPLGVGFLIVPAGIGWTLVAGVVHLRRG